MMIWPAAVTAMLERAASLDRQARRLRIRSPSRAAELRLEARLLWIQIDDAKTAALISEVG
jgi:hypothetical protein